MKLNTPTIVIGVTFLSVALLAFFVIVFPWLLLFLGISSLPNPPIPEITYGEFPFQLEYEIDGEIIVVEDTLICEYDGVGMNEGRGKFRKWKSHLASNKEEDNILLKSEGEKKIYYAVGDAKYYMGDADEYMYLSDYNYHAFPNAFYCEPNEVGGVDSGGINADELFDRYGIKLISWEPSPPIANTFVTHN